MGGEYLAENRDCSVKNGLCVGGCQKRGMSLRYMDGGDQRKESDVHGYGNGVCPQKVDAWSGSMAACERSRLGVDEDWTPVWVLQLEK